MNILRFHIERRKVYYPAEDNREALKESEGQFLTEIVDIVIYTEIIYPAEDI